jgi:hypothetical protein
MYKNKSLELCLHVLSTEYSNFTFEEYFNNQHQQKSLNKQGLNSLLKSIIKLLLNNDENKNYLNVYANLVNENSSLILFDMYLTMMNDEKNVDEKFIKHWSVYLLYCKIV